MCKQIRLIIDTGNVYVCGTCLGPSSRVHIQVVHTGTTHIRLIIHECMSCMYHGTHTYMYIHTSTCARSHDTFDTHIIIGAWGDFYMYVDLYHMYVVPVRVYLK